MRAILDDRFVERRDVFQIVRRVNFMLLLVLALNSLVVGAICYVTYHFISKWW